MGRLIHSGITRQDQGRVFSCSASQYLRMTSGEIPPTTMNKSARVKKGENGLPSHHLGPGKGFTNPWPSFKLYSMTQMLGALREWDSKRSQVPKDKSLLGAKNVPMDWERIKSPTSDGIQATWLGHAAFLIQMDGMNILCDPICSERCSPFQFMGPARYTPPAASIEEIQSRVEIDAVIISHNHYDHLDEATIKAIDKGGKGKLKYFVPLGVKAWFTSCGIKNVEEMDWWDEQKLQVGEKKLTIACTPCQHFSGRGLFDRMKTLWASWVIKSDTRAFYFAGDTGYRSVPNGSDEDTMPTCPVFKEIGQEHGPFQLACVPIGAYSPRQYMSPVHCSPSDAVCVHQDVRSEFSIGMHWGTFVLTDEPVDEPPKKLKEALRRKNISGDEFIVIDIGETCDSHRYRSTGQK